MEHSETLYIIPLTLAQANSFAARQRENYRPFRGRRFAIGCAMDEKLVGIVIAGKPIDEALDDGLTLAVNYIHATGGRTAYGMLYGAAARAAKALEQSLNILARIRERPELTAEYIAKEETP